jgi:hypothetical protein
MAYYRDNITTPVQVIGSVAGIDILGHDFVTGARGQTGTAITAGSP